FLTERFTFLIVATIEDPKNFPKP
ncbi:hypothetical protein OIHEL45_20636, partial [Sulfitobacter indolifex HEL-45]